jgi:hypothetical protein
MLWRRREKKRNRKKRELKKLYFSSAYIQLPKRRISHRYPGTTGGSKFLEGDAKLNFMGTLGGEKRGVGARGRLNGT